MALTQDRDPSRVQRRARFQNQVPDDRLHNGTDSFEHGSEPRPNSVHSGPEVGGSRDEEGQDDEDHEQDSAERQASVSERRGGKPLVLRTKSDFGPRGDKYKQQRQNGEHDKDGQSASKMRHGWETQLSSEEQAAALSQAFFMYWTNKRQEAAPKTDHEVVIEKWRMTDRLKTVGALLAVCLNLGVDPPDVVKTDPCARMECWIDPTISIPQGQNSSTVSNGIGKALQAQFEAMSMRTRFKLTMDPSVEDMKKYCTQMRKSSRDERILFYYNGHGVPRPTPAGEIWVFNRHYTQYIPISLYDLQTWLGAPGLFLYDCSAAGLVIKNFQAMAQKHETEQHEARRNDPNLPFLHYTECIHLAACRENEMLPSNPSLPADLFTSCLTTPIQMAIRYFILQNPLPYGPPLEDAGRIPGKISERRTPLGELNWIFTAITDTIAWNSLPKPLFKRLFRQDLMIAALFRNFLLAQRIMRTYHCHPQSYPEIADTHDSPLWQAWDYAVEMIVKQLPHVVEVQGSGEYIYEHSDFFADQLSAFEVYLGKGALDQETPQQLPIVLQVLLSQVHRLRALVLLSKFLDMGPWAVNLALSIGIFPYVLKLLQSQAQELKAVMVFIWARILALDQSCQTDLLKDNGYQYFINLINPSFVLPSCPNIGEHRAMCSFIIAMFCKDFKAGQNVCLSTNPEVIEYAIFHLDDQQEPLLRQYSCLCLSMLWKDFPEAKWHGIRNQAPQALAQLWQDPVPEVRTAMVHALTNFLGIPDLTEQVAEIETNVAETLLPLVDDGHSVVRKEYVVFLSEFIRRYKGRMVVIAWEEIVNERKRQLPHQSASQDVDGDEDNTRSFSSSESPNRHRKSSTASSSVMDRQNIYLTIWRQVLILSADPCPAVSQNAGIVMDAVFQTLFTGSLGQTAIKIVEDIVEHERNQASLLDRSTDMLGQQLVQDPQQAEPPLPTPPERKEGYLFAGLRRTASMEAIIKSLTGTFSAPRQNAESAAPSTSPESKSSNRTSGSNANSPAKSSNTSASVKSQRNGHAKTPSVSLQQRSQVPTEWTLPSDALDPRPLARSQYPESRPAQIPGFIPRDLAIPPKLPLESAFLPFAQSYFREPQMRPAESDEPGSIDFNERIWRRGRNDRIMSETQPLKTLAATGRWNCPVKVIATSTPVSRVVFHQFENHLLVADDRDGLSVWDWEEATRVGMWRNANPRGSKITDVRFVNEDDVALVSAGSSDGVVKLYRHYDSKDVELAATFRALSDLVPSTINAGCVCDWQQGQGRLLVAGDVRVIRVWSAATELCIADIPARSGSNVTCLTSDQVEGNVFVAGFGDGAVRVYDTRARPNESMVRVWKEHKGWIVGCHLQRGGMRELISAERGGAVRLWDIRSDKSVGVVKGKGEGGVGTLRSLSVHEHAPVFAAGSSHNALRVFATSSVTTNAAESSKPLSTIEPFSAYSHSSMLSSSHNRAAPVNATAFHPHRLMLACSVWGEGHVSLFKCVDRNGKDSEGKQGAQADVVEEWHQ